MSDTLKTRYDRFRRRTDETLPNKCDYCGLRVEYNDTEKRAEDLLASVNELRRLGLVDYPRQTAHPAKVPAIHHSSFCALAHSRFWGERNKHRKCPDWQLKIPGFQVTLADYLAIHHIKVDALIALRLGVLVGIAAVIGVVALLFWARQIG